MNRIRELRKNAGLTQQQVAVAIGVKRSTLAMWETEKNSPSINIAIKLADTLGCTLDDLIVRESK